MPTTIEAPVHPDADERRSAHIPARARQTLAVVGAVAATAAVLAAASSIAGHWG